MPRLSLAGMWQFTVCVWRVRRGRVPVWPGLARRRTRLQPRSSDDTDDLVFCFLLYLDGPAVRHRHAASAVLPASARARGKSNDRADAYAPAPALRIYVLVSNF
ncbi:hypothetical protein EVAR_77767_1 [Eumeta japonica]|uniref:Uncharacterized protein n=1 Tax=Eumeta variegata TaxID=151549 RepID=A0A4C1TEB9_EUMVA|nr:hypothetical protein EVAR_77767_1 [Eumeta japonica]